MGQKHTLKLIKKVLQKKRNLYTPEELIYMRLQYELMKEQRKQKKLAKKQRKGFK